MNETIGAKGGRRDRKRTLHITKENKKKLQEYNKQQEKLKLEKLEKKVRRQQIITFFKAVPIVIAGKTFKTLVNNTTNKEQKEQEIEMLVEKPKVPKIIQVSKEKNIIIHSNIVIKNIKENKPEIKQLKEDLKQIKGDSRRTEIKKIKQEDIELPKTSIIKNKENIEVLTETPIINKTPKKGISIENKDKTQKKELENIKNKEILNKYEKKLKEVRTDLKKLDFEYMILEEESNKLYNEKDAEELLNRLNTLIDKIKELKEKIKTSNFSLYDQNYLEELIKDYVNEFNDKKVVKEIKDSPLYIMISDKLNELDGQKKKLKSKVENKKHKLNIDEKKLKALKEKYYDFNHINKILRDIEYSQERELSILMEKVKNSKTEVEKVTYEIDAMTRQSKKIVRRMKILALIPGIRSAKALSTMTAYYMYMMKQVKNPGIKRRVTKEINVKDYKIDIENSLDKINEASRLIGGTTSKLKKEITKFKKDFKEYFSIVPECRVLLSNLNYILDDLENKQKEINNLKTKQTKLLKDNNKKVLQYKKDNM